MAVEVVSKDTVESGGTATIKNGVLTDTRRFIVTGLSEFNSRTRRVQALKPSVTGKNIPVEGERHPSGEPSWVLSRSATMFDPDMAEVTVTYGVPSAEQFDVGTFLPDLTVGSTVTEVQTDFTWDMLPNATQLVQVPVTTSHNGDAKPVQTFSKMQGLTTFSYEAVQRGSPGDLSIEFVPTVNDQALFGDPVKHPEGSWLCSRIGGRLVNRDDDTYLVTYEFIYSPPYKLKPEGVTGFPEAGLDVEGWQVVVVEHDKTTGQPYPVNEWIYEPAADGKRTIAVVDVYPKKNFASLPIG